MPIYEYECSNCGKRFEIFQKISDNPLRECKFCRGTLNKLISNCSFQLKGTGWYATDYKKPVDTAGKSAHSDNGNKDTEKAETKTDATAAASSEAKTEAKTETKSETKAEAKTESKVLSKNGGENERRR
jgi:putative FmdB family regulatory protein